MRPYYEDARNGIVIYHGDCRDVLPTLAEPVDLLLTSPPYNCGMDYEGHDDDTDTKEYFDFIEDCVHVFANAIGAGGYLALNVPNWIGSRGERVWGLEEYKAILDRHIPFHDLAVWVKSPANGTAWGNFPNAPFLRANHEWVLIHKNYGPKRGDSDITWDQWSRYTQSVWQINPVLPYRKEHPATFPDELARRIALLYSPAAGLVCDPFLGSGTTLEVAKSLGRRAIGVEMNERYCEIAAKRLCQENLFSMTEATR